MISSEIFPQVHDEASVAAPFKDIGLILCFLVLFCFVLIVFFFPEYGPVQLFLSCGLNVTIYVELLGFGITTTPLPSISSSRSFVSQSWENDQEEIFYEAQVFLFIFFFLDSIVISKILSFRILLPILQIYISNPILTL